MFISLDYDDGGSYLVKDTDFKVKLPIPYRYSFNRGYYLYHNKKLVKSAPYIATRVLALILEYKRRNLPIAKNLAKYFLFLNAEEGTDEQCLSDRIIKTELWFKTNCPETNFPTKCILNQIEHNKWVNGNNKCSKH